MTTGQVQAAIGGQVAPGFEALAAELGAAVDSGDELGASLAVLIEGQVVVDVWGGWRTTAQADAWQRDTVVNVWSASKVISAIAVLRLQSLGAIDIDLPVAAYWPEFARNGKSGVLLRHVLAHSSGVPGWDPVFTLDDLYDFELSSSRLADQAPWWEPGTQSGYHALTQGALLDAVVRHACGSPLSDIVATELRDRLRADVQLGVSPDASSRVAELDPPPVTPRTFPADLDRSIMTRTFTQPRVQAHDAMSDEWRAASLPAVNVHANARSLALVASALAQQGTVDGSELLDAGLARRAITPQTGGRDLVLGTDVTWGMGLAASTTSNPAGLSPGPRWYWGGWGGSLIVVDPRHRITFAYTMNRMSPEQVGSPRGRRYLRVLDDCLSRHKEGS